jgi:hypothetical protein
LGAATAIENDGRLVETLPSETDTTMPLKVSPARLLVGVPEMRPLDGVKLAQLGRFVTEKVSESPSESDAVGWKL